MFANLQKWRQISDSFRQTTWNIIKLKESIKTPKSTEIEIITFRINYKQRTTMQLYWPENLVWLLTRNLALDFLHFEAPKATLFWLNQSIEEAKSKNEHTNRRTLSSCRFLTSKCEHAGRILVEDLISSVMQRDWYAITQSKFVTEALFSLRFVQNITIYKTYRSFLE